MGVDYTAYAVVGCEVPVGKLYRKVLRRGCKHDVPEGARFCPVCGAQVVIDDEDLVYEECIGKFRIWWGTDRMVAVVGIGVSAYDSDWLSRMPIEESQTATTMEMLYDELRATLLPLGLWDAERFGLYAILHCSY
jgi:hypothetical protein